MKTFVPWFASAVLLATLVAECGSPRLAANAPVDVSGEVHTLRNQIAALEEENARLRWQAVSATQESARAGS
jgi:outer membrane murein-binding lipoprotein Lpp